MRTMRNLHLEPVGRDTIGLDKAYHGVNVDLAGLDHLCKNEPLVTRLAAGVFKKHGDDIYLFLVGKRRVHPGK